MNSSALWFRAARKPRWAAGGVAAGVVVVAAAAYLWLGPPKTLFQQTRVAPDAAHQVTPQQIAHLTEQLAERLKQKPDDVQGWVMLARSYGALGRRDASAQAYAQAAKLAPNNAGLLADYADALAQARDRKLEGEPFEIVKRALEADPSARSIQASIREARELGKLPSRRAAKAPGKPAITAAAAITGRVKLAPALASRVAPGDALFIFARPADGSRTLLAVLRARAGDLPYEFRLDDSQAMTPNARLSTQARVVVIARVSKSGNAMAKPGDLQGSTKPVAPGASGLELVISEVRE